MNDVSEIVACCVLVLLSLACSVLGAIFFYMSMTEGLGLEVKSWWALIGYYLVYALCNGFAKGIIESLSKLNNE